jgi:parvulin-like peptidyl-prolyl isomerase
LAFLPALGPRAPVVSRCLAQDGDAVAIINGQPLSKTKLVDVLIESHGLSVLQQLILADLARQHAARLGLRITAADVDREFDDALDRIARESGMAGNLATRDNKLKALNSVLESRGVSMAEFMIGMERNACLRRVVEKELVITDDTLREEFARTYSERVVVRHIQLPVGATGELNAVQAELARGADFADVARRLSRNVETAARGGELAPFTFDDASIPAALREAAFSMRPDEISPAIRTDEWLHILKFERRIPTENVRFEDVRSDVETRLRNREIPERMNRLAQSLFTSAKVAVVDPRLKPKYEELMKQNAQSARQP